MGQGIADNEDTETGLDPIPNESTVIAAAIIGSAEDWAKEHRETSGLHFGLAGPGTSAAANCPLCSPAPTLAARGAMGHHGDDDYATCNEHRHWERIPAGVLADDLLADEIEMDLL